MKTSNHVNTVKRAKVTIPQPIGDRILVLRDDPVAETEGGIVLPEASREVPRQGVVVMVGNGRMLDTGQRATFNVAAGDRIAFTNYAGTELDHDGVTYIIMREEDVLAKLPV